VYLSGRRITPLKIVSHIKYTPDSRLFVDIEWLYSGSRKKFAPQANGTYKFGEGPVNAYGIVNLSAGYTMKNGINIFGGIENLLNKDYYNTTAQWYALPANYMKANGIHYQVGIGYKW
jgi:iron complex outermembrane receptor protein